MPQTILHYEVLERLGEGARSTIYAVSDPNTHQLYALKHVVRAEAKDIRFIEQMETEYEVGRQFTHPGLRRCYDLKITKTFLVKVSEAVLIMELVDGKPLDVRLPPTLPAIVDTFIQSAQALGAMHAMGYAHCDIKPNNILTSDNGKVKIIDFGQSCRIGTVKERIQGTPDYIAPEQVKRRPISQQTDVFNLGATLYWALTGKHIPTMYTIKQSDTSFLVDDRIQTPLDLNPSLPPVLSNLCMECIATRAQKRPESMDAVITRLELAKHILLKQGGAAPSLPVSPMPPEPSDDIEP